MAYLYTVNTTSQTVAEGGFLNYATNVVKSCNMIQHTAGSNTITIPYAGVYKVSVNADVEPSASGLIGITLLNNGVAVAGATANMTGVTSEFGNLGFTALIKVLPSCCAISNTANLQVQLSALGTVSNTAVTIVRE